MSGISKFKGIYTEGVSFEIGSGHKGAQRQTKIANLAARTTNPGEKAAAEKKLKGPKLPSVRNEETELDEGMTIQDFKKQRSRQKQKAKRAAEKTSPTRRAGMTSYERAVRHRADVDPDYDYGDEERVYPGGITKNPKKIRKAKALGEIGEAIDVGADAGKTISDFVHSKSKTFKGDSKKQRIKRALGAYYGAQKEEVENSYECVIEALVEYGFAEDEETANDMIIGLSEGFIGMIFEEYLEEKARGTRKKTTAHAYDMDETLFGHDHSKVKVHVHNEKGERVQSLSNQEFNTHKLPKGHSYNFDEFRSSEVFKKSAKPLKKMIKHLNRQKARGYDTHIVTARSDMDDQAAFAKHLSKYGININPGEKGEGHVHVHRTGNLPGSDVGVKKRDTLQGLAQKHGYKKIHMYDDAAKVHKAVQNTPGVEVKTHMVKPRGKSGEVRARSFRATETQKEQYYIDFGTNVEELREVDITPYECWKEFIR